MPRYDGTKHMIPINTRPPEEARALRVKGGSVKSQNKKDAQKMRFIKERLMKNNLREQDVAWVMQCVEDRKIMGYELMAWAEKQKQEMPPEAAFKVGELLSQVARFVHGDKSSVDVRGVSVNVDLMVEEVDAHLKKVFGG